MDLRKIADNVRKFQNKFRPQNTEIISPVPAGETMTKGLEFYYKTNALRENQARQANENPQPQRSRKVQYGEALANAPDPKQQRAIQLVRQTRPDFKGSDQDIVVLFNKYQDKLLNGLTGKIAQVTPGRGESPTLVLGQKSPKNFLVEGLSQVGIDIPQPTPTPTRPPVNASVTPEDQQLLSTGNRNVDPNVENFLVNIVFPITRKYGIPDAVAAGQFAREGRFRGVGANLNNFFNIGFTDTLANSGNYGAVPRYASPEAGIEAYARFITGQADPSIYANGEDGSRSGKIGRLQLEQIASEYANDPIGYLRAIGPMYSSQGHEYAPNVMNTPEFRRFFNQ